MIKSHANVEKAACFPTQIEIKIKTPEINTFELFMGKMLYTLKHTPVSKFHPNHSYFIALEEAGFFLVLKTGQNFLCTRSLAFIYTLKIYAGKNILNLINLHKTLTY